MAQVEEVSPFEGTLSWGQMTLAADSRACSELTTSILPASEAVSASSNTPGWYYRSNFKGNTCDAVNDVAYEISAEITNTCLVTPLGAIYNHCDSSKYYCLSVLIHHTIEVTN